MSKEQLLQVDLEFREGSSDKVYRAAIEQAAGGFVVNFAYGRRGQTLNTGTKTAKPVGYAEAVQAYEKLVGEKTSKGYKPAAGSRTSAGIGASVVDREKRDTGLRPQLLNPITEEEAVRYLTDDSWCEQEKFNGRRMQIRKTDKTILAANRDGLVVGFPDIVAEQLVQVPFEFEIDGEIIGDSFKAYDLLLDNSGDLRSTIYGERVGRLHEQFSGVGKNIDVAATIRGTKAKRRFMAEMKIADREGVVFKDLHAVWNAGRPASGGAAMKCKFWATCSCVVMGINGTKRSIAVGLGSVLMGNVTIPANYDIPKPGAIVEVRYLYCVGVGGSLYQPCYLGERDDVHLEDCTVERQRIKYKPED